MKGVGEATFWGTLWVVTGIAVIGCMASRATAETILVVGTNSPEDAARLNEAIAQSSPGAEIVLRGTFLLQQPIRLRGNRTYRGESRPGTILKQADGAKLPALLASDTFLDDKEWTGEPIVVRDLTLVGNRAGNPGADTAGLIVRSWLSVIENLHIADMPGDGLRLTSVSANGTRLKNTQVNGRISGCFIERCGRHGIHVEDPVNAVTDWTLSDCWIASPGADGIHMDNAAGWFVVRNHIYDVARHAIYAHRLCGSSVSDNYIEDFGKTTEAGEWSGIYATVQGDGASTIAHNRIFNFGGEKQPDSRYRYLALAVNYETGLVVVTGNIIRGAGTPRGIGMSFVAAEKRRLIVVSSGNAVENVATPQQIGERVSVMAGL